MIEALYAENYNRMMFYAQSFLGDFDLAEVAVQETFVVALRKHGQLSACEDKKGWLYRALKYVLKHIIRDRRRLLLRTVSIEDAGIDAATYSDAYSETDKNVRETGEYILLSQLYVQGYSIKELAEHYGISEGACKMRIKRAKDALRTKLEGKERAR